MVTKKVVTFLLLSAILLPFMNSIIMVLANSQENFTIQNEEILNADEATKEELFIQNLNNIHSQMMAQTDLQNIQKNETEIQNENEEHLLIEETQQTETEEQMEEQLELEEIMPTAFSDIVAPIALADTVAADITDSSALGTINHYNGIVFDGFIASQADIEGAFAAGGKAYIATKKNHGFDFGGAIKSVGFVGGYTNPNGYPALLLNDAPVLGKTLEGGEGGSRVGIIGGPAVLNISSKAGYEENTLKFSLEGGGLLYATDEIVDQFFADVKAKTTKTVNVLNQAGTGEITASGFNARASGANVISDFTNWSENDLKAYEANGLKNTGSLRILVFNITDSGQVSVRGPAMTSAFTRYDLIIFNFPNATGVSFDYESVYIDNTQLFPGGGVHTTHVPNFANRIVWNIPEATSVNVNSCSVIGSVLAPKAAVKGSGGSINGMLIANSYETVNSCELHAFQLRKEVFDFEKDEPEEEKGVLVVTKTDEEDTPLDGVEFLLYYIENGTKYYYNQDSWTSNREKAKILATEKGAVTISGLPYKTYYLEEIKTLEDYELLTDAVIITIEKEHNAFTVVNEKKTIETPLGGLTIEKIDKDTREVILSEATFKLYRITDGMKYFYQQTEENIQWTTEEKATLLSTGSTGTFTVTGLPYDTYYLREVSAPAGYTILAADQPVAVEKEETVQIKIENQQEEKELPVLGGLQIIKHDSQDEEKHLSGAEFLLYYLEKETAKYYKVQDGKVVFTEDKDQATIIRTDSGGTTAVTSLPLGDYYLVETKAPGGYVLATNAVKITVEDSILQVVKISNDPVPEEAEKTGRLTVIKIDRDENETLLTGAEFMLYRFEKDERIYYGLKDKTIFWTNQQDLAYIFTTDEQGKFTVDELPLGDYILQEQKAPFGYILNNEEIPLTIVEAGVEKTIENQKQEEEIPVLGGLKIIKQDSQDENKYLSGAEFVLYYLADEIPHYYKDENGVAGFTALKEEADIIRTDDSGTITVSGLPLGTYYLEEIKAPAGYVLAEDAVEVAIENEAVASCIIPNEEEVPPEEPEKPIEPEEPGNPQEPDEPDPEEPEEPENPDEPNKPEKEKPGPKNPGKKPSPEEETPQVPGIKEPEKEIETGKKPQPDENIAPEPVADFPDEEDPIHNEFAGNEAKEGQYGDIFTFGKENPKTGDMTNHYFRFYSMIMICAVSLTVIYYLHKN